ncbi:ESX secretion-associated protein EspG [Nocardia sp. CDC153]|uniref:ESX secretion-associated protein EspG n=1 Tax=Nocardia sp. CDC153 TaxID=3112167 RepID=UPI002DB7B559|nr:ESX secretion-associated protein EspG [Nocardia sp. CDC153]MEC3955018.1 ESX secretion-associated protein EspG [Nocardia sp. CDC153]
MTQSWRFTEAEFYALWTDRTGEELPEPFMFTSTAKTADEFENELREARKGLSSKLGGDFQAVFDTIANPDLFLTAYGWDEQDRWATSSMKRLRATRKGPKGCLVTQLPGETYWVRGGYLVEECDPLRLSDAIVAALPSAEHGGRGDVPLASPEQDLDHDYGYSAIAARSETAVSVGQAFLKAPMTTVGEISIVQGSSVFGPRGIARHKVLFRDLEDDGRYAIVENPAQALAVDQTRFVSVLNRYVAAVIQTIKDERA